MCPILLRDYIHFYDLTLTVDKADKAKSKNTSNTKITIYVDCRSSNAFDALNMICLV